MAVLSVCCALWCRLNVNGNFGAVQGLVGAALEEVGEFDRDLLGDMIWAMMGQRARARYSLFQQVAGSQLYLEPAMEQSATSSRNVARLRAVSRMAACTSLRAK